MTFFISRIHLSPNFIPSSCTRSSHRSFSTTFSVFQNAKPMLGFIGLGQMGHPMSNNLVQNSKGQFSKLLIYDTVSSATTSLHELYPTETEIANSLPDLASKADVIFTMLPTPSIVEQVYLDPKQGLISNLKPSTLLLDSSTIDPETSQRVAKQVYEKTKAMVLDAPVSGGTVGAKAGTLTFMVGGPKEGFERAKMWLKYMGQNLVHCGDHGTGQIAKLCNNMLLGATMFATSEALNLGAQLGLPPSLLLPILNTSTGRSWSSEIYPPVPNILPHVPSSNQYEGGFSLSLMQKDMGLAIQSAQKVKAPVPLSAVADQLYKQLMNVPGWSKKDFSISYAWLNQHVRESVDQKKKKLS